MIRSFLNVLFKRETREQEGEEGDNIYWENSVNQGVARVHVAPDGTIYYWQYPNIKALKCITDPKQVVWLTCHPSKYFPQDPTP